MFKPFLLLPVCVALFLSFVTPSLYAGVIPPKSTDLSVKSLKEENPELWNALGLDALGNDDTELHLADNSNEILFEALQAVISSLPQEQISFEDIVDGDSNIQVASKAAASVGRRLALEDFSKLLGSDEFSERFSPQEGGDQTALQPWSPRSVLQHYLERARRYCIQIRQTVMGPLAHYYGQARNHLQRIAGYCDQFLGQHCPSLFYNPMAIVGRGTTIDPAAFPARWLQIREIRDHLWQQWVRINSRHFTSRLRRFDNLRLPDRLNWPSVQIRGFSFQGSVLSGHRMSYCQIVETNLKGTQIYRCSISCSELSGVQTDLQTQLQTSAFQNCVTQDTITTLLAVTGVQSTADASWQGLVDRMMSIYFVSQLQQHVLLQQLVAAITSDQVSEFIDYSQALINLYPELFSVALQVMYIVSQQNEELKQYRPNIQMLMSHHAADALMLISTCSQLDSAAADGGTGVMMRQVIWPETPITLTAEQLNYQHNLIGLMQQYGVSPATVPKDDQCFYHVLAQHVAETNPNLTQEDKKKRADLLRQMIASYLFVYMTNLYAQDELSQEFSVDEVMQTKMDALSNVLAEDQIDIAELVHIAHETAHPNGWAGQMTGMTAAIVLEQPVFMINDHGPNVQVSLMFPDGTSVSDEAAQAAIQGGQGPNVIPVVFDSVNHWFTMVGAMLQTWLVLQGQQPKGF